MAQDADRDKKKTKKTKIDLEEGLIRIPPQALDVEQSVLASIFLDRDAMLLAVETIEANYFYKNSHRIIYQAMLDLFNNKTEIDLLTVTDMLQKKKELEDIGGVYYLTEIVNSTPTSANVEEHLNIIKEKALARLLISGGTEIIEKAYDQSEGLDELLDFAELTRKYPIHVRFIEYMPIGSSSVWNPADMVSGDQIIEQISTEIAGLEPVVTELGGPARLYRLPGAPGKIGVITAMSNHFCDSCNRIRVTADGHLRACLLSDKEFPLRVGEDPEKIAEIVRLAVASKSAEHGLACNSERKCARVMSTIGG